MQEALGREEDRGGDTDLIDNLSPLQFLKDRFVFIPIIRDSLIYIVTLSHCVQVEGGGDPDDLEELEDAQSLAKVKVITPLH